MSRSQRFHSEETSPQFSDTSGASGDASSTHPVDRYIGDVLEGGHLLFFANGGSAHVPLIMAGFRELDAHAYVPVLSEAARLWAGKPRRSRYTLADLLDAVIAQEFAECDRRFHECSPSWQHCLNHLDHPAAVSPGSRLARLRLLK